MLLTLQYPLADARPFVKDSGRSTIPHWRDPRPDEEFLRSFGAMRLRRSFGLPGWVGENVILEAKQALRFPKGLGAVVVDAEHALQLQCIYRRFFADGWAVGKYEVGVGTLSARRGQPGAGIAPIDIEQLPGEKLAELIHRFLHTPVSIRNPQTAQPEVTELARAGKALAALYRAMSSEHLNPGAPDWWVVHGSPLLFLEVRSHDAVELPQPLYAVELHRKYRLHLSYCLWPYEGRRIRMWVLRRAPRSGYREEYRYARTLRLYLLRLHAEHECLQAILRHIGEGRLSVMRGDPESKALQSQLARSLEHIGSDESRAADDFNPEIAAVARQSTDAMSPGQRDRLVERLKELDIRGNLVRGVKQYADGVLAGTEGQGAAQMQAETKLDLVKALLACPSIRNADARKAIVDLLPAEIRNTTARSSLDIVDVMNLVGAALNYTDGLVTLVELVRSVEGDSLPLREVDRVMAEWRGQQTP